MNGHASLNRIYRLVWNALHQTWVVAPELARGRGKAGPSTALLSRSNQALVPRQRSAGGARAFALPLLAAALLGGFGGALHAAPKAGQVIAGDGSVSASGTTTTVQQASDRLTLTWQSFNVAKTETVHFLQPSFNALAVNHILDSNGSQIMGHINANGQIWLINPNGVLFGKDAQINVGALVASTLNPDDASIGTARTSFSGNSHAAVVNLGNVQASAGGYVAMLGHSVSNQGQIEAPGGSVALGAGNMLSLNFDGSSLLGLQVQENQIGALASNGGLIAADGGQVLLSAGARDSLLASAVNNTGTIQARTVQERDGKIVLTGGMLAGTTTVGGTLDASARQGGKGGFVETSAKRVQVADGTQVNTASASGQHGKWLIDLENFTVAATNGNITGRTLSSNLASNDIEIKTNQAQGNEAGDLTVNDNIKWQSGHTLTLNAGNNITIQKVIDASAGAGGKLALLYGQATKDGANADYSVKAKVNLQAGANFSTQQGSDGAVTRYTVITQLGQENDHYDADASNSLQGLGYTARLGGNYVLGADIDASGTASWSFFPIGEGNSIFSGRFGGLGHVIDGLTILPRFDNSGLFSATSSTAHLRDLGLTNVHIDGLTSNIGGLVGANSGTISKAYVTGTVVGGNYVGGLVGSNTGTISNSYATGTVGGGGYYLGGLVGSNTGTISNSYATGAVTGAQQVGGLVGSSTGTISNSYATGAVTGRGTVGGLVGYNMGGTIRNSYSKSTVTGYKDEYIWDFGGLVGLNTGTISNSYATGTVNSGENFLEGSEQIGGLVGSNYGTIERSYATGAVTGTYSVGGLVGYNMGGTIRNSYSKSTVTGLVSDNSESNKSGGLVGYNDKDSTITNSYATGAVSGEESVGGLVGYNQGTVESSYATGAVSGASLDLGGLVGTNVVGTISNSYSKGTVTGKGGSSRVGGLVGYNTRWEENAEDPTGDAPISNSYATGAVSGYAEVGGLVGYNEGKISSSYATGAVSGSIDMGGLVGSNFGTISNAYSKSTVTVVFNPADLSFANASGGLVGQNGGTVSNSYATGAVSGDRNVGGLVGFNSIYGTIESRSYATGAVSGSKDLGGLVGFNRGTISNAYSKSTVTGVDGSKSIIGGLVGGNEYGTIRNSYATGAVSGSESVGGLVGVNYDSGTIERSYSTGAVTGNKDVGGLAGSNWGIISNAYSKSTVKGVNVYTISSNIGGLAGTNKGTISDAYARGAVSGDLAVGGLVGLNTSTIESRSYATGDVSGYQAVGGLVGSNDGIISNSYSKGNVTGDDKSRYIGGLVGSNGGTISASYATGTVSGYQEVGGLVGLSVSPSTIDSRSYATGAVSGYISVGGLAGESRGTISNSYSKSTVNGVVGSEDFYGLGGLVGNNSGTISDSYAKGKVRGDNSVGGLVGSNSGTIERRSYATGAVSGGSYVGGLAGYNQGTISNSYSKSAVTGDVGSEYIGGLDGMNIGTISDSYATGKVIGYNNIGGLVGGNSGIIKSGSYSSGNVSGEYNVGALTGLPQGTISDSYSKSTVTVLYRDPYNTGPINSYDPGNVYGFGLGGNNFLSEIQRAYENGVYTGYR
jgi:filamentous hemagglutinin family protein